MYILDYADLCGLRELYSSKEVFCTKKRFVFGRCKTPPELQKERCGIKFLNLKLYNWTVNNDAQAPKGRNMNNPVRSAGYEMPPCFSRGALPALSGTPVRRASAGGFIVHPRAAFRGACPERSVGAALARGYSCFAPSGLGELRIKNWLTPQLEINKK